MTAPLVESRLPLPMLRRGKVREVYEVDRDALLMVASDRVSAFDVVLSEPVPHKGAVLTQLSAFWFRKLAGVLPHHLLTAAPDEIVARVPVLAEHREAIAGRAMLVQRTTPVPFECVVRGYVIGSSWKDYQETGAICGIRLPAGLLQAARLPEPIFTPASKAEAGDHDENISFEEAQARTEALLAPDLAGTSKSGAQLVGEARDAALRLYSEASNYAATRGIIIADTKFEFGIDAAGTLHLIDEALTPDSSRFWPASQYREGISPPSFDKQYVRDYLETLDWNKRAPGPELPVEVVEATAAKYREAHQRLTGQPLA